MNICSGGSEPTTSKPAYLATLTYIVIPIDHYKYWCQQGHYKLVPGRTLHNNSSGTSKLFDYNYNVCMRNIFTIQLKNNCMKLSFQSYLLQELNPTLLSETSLQSKQWSVSLILLTYYLYWLCCIHKYLHFNAHLRSTCLVSKHTCNLHIHVFTWLPFHTRF